MDIKIEKSEKIIQHNVLLANLPYWMPLVPPMGIAVLKNALRDQGHRVKTVDLNIEKEFKEPYNRYFDTFKKFIPKNKKDNVYNIGHDVLQQHMMAHINFIDEKEYFKLVKILIDTVFFSDACEEQVREHIAIMNEIYLRLENYFLRLFEKEKPTVLGLTVYKGTMAPALFAFKLAKETIPGITTVMGGGVFVSTLIPGSPDLETFLEKTTDYIDRIMIGSGDMFMVKLLGNELPESRRVFTQKDIYKDQLVPFPKDIPDLSDFDIGNYPYIAVSASKGCLYKCSFCNSSVFFGEYLQRPIEHTVEEMIKLYETYGRRIFFMTDTLLNPIINELAAGVSKSGPALYYDGYFRIDEACRDLQNNLHWRSGGFYRARLGVESGSQRILDLMDKKITVELIRASLAGLSYAGIKPTAYFVVGHPGETEEDFRMTLNLLEEIRNDIWQAECSPFYYYSSQPAADIWANRKKPLYPGNAVEMLMLQTYLVDDEPSREELCDRVFRFGEHCKKLAIPNPYSLKEIHEADERWKKLHDNAAPPLLELMNSDPAYHENTALKLLNFAQTGKDYNSDFGF